MPSIVSKVKSIFTSGKASLSDARGMPYYQLTQFTPSGKPVIGGETKSIRRGKQSGVSRMASEVRDFLFGRILTDQEFLRARVRHQMDDEAPLTSPYDQVAAVYACVRARAVPISMVPLKVFEWERNPKTGEEQLVETDDNPLAEVLYNPNPVTSSYNLKEGGVANLSLNGEFFWLLDREEPTDFPKHIWPLPVTQVKPINDRVTNLPVAWLYDPGPTFNKQIFELHQIVHGKRWSSTSYVRGQGDGKAASMATGQDWDAQRYNRTFLKNSCDPGGVFKLPEGVTLDPKQEEKVLKAWTKRHQGPSRAGRPGILEGGMEWVNNAIPHRDMAWLEQREFNLQDIRMTYGVPKIQLGMTENVPRASAEVQERIFWTNELIPETRLIEDALWDVLRFIENGRYEVLFDFRGIAALAKDLDEKMLSAKRLHSIGVPVSEINRLLDIGLEPFDGWDISYLPVSLLPASMSGQDVGGEARSARGLIKPVGRAKALPEPEPRTTPRRAKREAARQRLLPVTMAGHRTKVYGKIPTNGKALPPDTVDAEVYPFTKEEDAAYVKFQQEVYEDDEKKYASKYSKWVMEHRVETLRNFKRETDWDGDPTRAVSIPDELREAIENLKPKAYEPDFFDQLLGLHVGISDQILALDDETLERIMKAAGINIKKILPDGKKWGDLLGEATRKAYEDALLTGATARARDIGTPAQIDAIRTDLARWIERVCTKPIKKLSPKLNRDISRALAQGIADGETVDQLAVRIKQIHNKAGNRAATIARTEVGKAGEFGAYQESKESDLVVGHFWVPGGLNVRDWHASMRGQFRKIDKTFTSGQGNALLHPHDPDGKASEVISCKCVLRPKLKR